TIDILDGIRHRMPPYGDVRDAPPACPVGAIKKCVRSAKKNELDALALPHSPNATVVAERRSQCFRGRPPTLLSSACPVKHFGRRLRRTHARERASVKQRAQGARRQLLFSSKCGGEDTLRG